MNKMPDPAKDLQSNLEARALRNRYLLIQRLLRILIVLIAVGAILTIALTVWGLEWHFSLAFAPIAICIWGVYITFDFWLKNPTKPSLILLNDLDDEFVKTKGC